LILGTVTALV